MADTPAARAAAPDAVASAREAAPRAGAIILARHGRPALDRTETMGWRGFEAWWDRYDAGGLAANQTPPDDLVAAAQEADVVMASPLRRSQETAARVAGDKPVAVDPVFLEAPLPPPPLPGLRMRPGVWSVMARIAWWLGLSRGRESRIAAEHRADRAVDAVVAHADQGAVVLVCAHGWFNRMMRPVLLARGWRCVRDGRDRYWSHRRYERVA